jgi:hypothetical protein
VALVVIKCGFGGHQMWLWWSSNVALVVIKCGFGKAAFGHQLWF